MKRKNKLLFPATLLAILSLSGCGERNLDSAKEIPAPGTETVSLTVWGAAEDEELLRQIIDGFLDEYRGQADFSITFEPQSESTCTNILMDDLENGADVFAFADDQLNTLVAAGALDPVENPESVKESNLEEAVLAASVNDTLYALPLTADNGYFLYYNKRFFSEKDIESLDRMLDVAEDNGKKVSMECVLLLRQHRPHSGPE